MIGHNCIEKLRQALQELGIMLPELNQGSIEFQEELGTEHFQELKSRIETLGFEIVDEENSALLNRISESINELIRTNIEIPLSDYPVYLMNAIGYDSTNVMRLFLQVHGVTLPRYIELHRLNRVKEMLLYEDCKISEIATMLQFRNEAQLIRMFKKNTGLTPYYYKKIKRKRLKVLNKADSRGIEL